MKPPLIMLCFIYIIRNNEMAIKTESVSTTATINKLIKVINSTTGYPEELTTVSKRGNNSATQNYTKLPAEEFPANSSSTIHLVGDILNNSDPCAFNIIRNAVRNSFNDPKSYVAHRISSAMKKYREITDNMTKSIQSLLRSSNEILKLLNSSDTIDAPTNNDDTRFSSSSHNVSLSSSGNINCSKSISDGCCSTGDNNHGTRFNVSVGSSLHNVSRSNSSGNINCSKAISDKCCSTVDNDSGTRFNVSADSNSRNVSRSNSSDNINCNKAISNGCCSADDNNNGTRFNVSADSNSRNVSRSNNSDNINCSMAISNECCSTGDNNNDTRFNVSTDSSLHNVNLSSSDNINSSKVINTECCSVSDVLVVCTTFLLLLAVVFVAYKIYQKYFPSIRQIEHQTLVENGIYNNPL